MHTSIPLLPRRARRATGPAQHALLALHGLLALVLLVLGACRDAPTTPAAPAAAQMPGAGPRAYLVAGPRYTQLSAGFYHGCALRSDGTITCWGSGSEAGSPDGADFTQVSAGTNHTCALRRDGAITCWGNNTNGQATPPSDTNFTQVSAGGYSTCALRRDGSVVCWGIDDIAQATPAGTGFARVSTGNAGNGCALRTDGSIACWGRGAAAAPTGVGYTRVATRDTHACALTAAGAIVCWGEMATPPAGTGYTHVGVGHSYSCALTGEGAITCWGNTGSGALSNTPTGTGFTELSMGGLNSCARTAAGAIVCWGYGLGVPPAAPAPTRVPPTATLTAPATAVAGEAYLLTLSGAQVPGHPAATRFTYAFDCGTGQGYAPAGTAATASCVATAAGTRTVRGTVIDQDGDTASYAATIEITRAPQAITFTSAPPRLAVVGGTYTLAATGGASGNPVVFSTLTPATCTLTGSTVQFAAAGPCMLAADQAGTADHLAAPQRTQTLTVTAPLAPQTITFANRLQDELGVLGLFTLVKATGGASGQRVVLTSRTPTTCTIGPATPLGVTLRFVAVGPCTIAADQAGTAAYAAAPTATQTMKVVYPFVGFLPPVKGGLVGSGTVNVVAAGKGIPLRFTLAADRGLGILAGTPTSTAIACPTHAREERVKETVAANSSRLAYDARTLRYTYTWATDAAWAGTCRRFTLALNDGTTENATFRFTK